MRTVVSGEGRSRTSRRWEAQTRFEKVADNGSFSLLRVEIHTGVTHQIRAHLLATGHPLVGDLSYGNARPDPLGLGHQFLHACSLGFDHPGTGREVNVDSPLPEELSRLLQWLGL